VPEPYVPAVLAAYHALPDTPRRASRHDLGTAAALAARGVPLDTVKIAFLVATARRTFRPVDALPLGPIRSLAYFLPVVDELQAHPPQPPDIDSLRIKLATAGVRLPA
jgi:hypothetical protein